MKRQCGILIDILSLIYIIQKQNAAVYEIRHPQQLWK